MNVIFVVDGVPDSTQYYTEHFGVDCCVIEMRSELTNKVHSIVDDPIVKKILKDGTAEIGEKYLKAIGECAAEYTEKIMRKIREYGYNEELAKLHFLGGGAMLMKHFAKIRTECILLRISMQMPRAMSTFPTSAVSENSDRGRRCSAYGKKGSCKEHKACILSL